MSDGAALLRLLADGGVHSEAALAHALGLTRTALTGELKALARLGLETRALSRSRHRLAAPLELFDRARIAAALAPGERAQLARLELLFATDSTNARLLAARDLAAGRWQACLAEFQSAGRGRRGREWIAPLGSGLCMSFGWTFRAAPASLAALGLAAGVAVVRALAQHGVTGLGLKWPNDILLGGGKLGGVLCELRAEASGPAYVVIGVGLNLRLPPGTRGAIAARGGLPAAELAASLAQGALPSRSLLAATLLNELLRMIVEFEARGIAPFVAEWSAADVLRDRPVRISGAARARQGVARGIDTDGALCVETDGRLERLASGDVTLRAVA